MGFLLEFSAEVYGYWHSVLDKIWIRQLLIHGVEIKIGLKIYDFSFDPESFWILAFLNR